MEESQLLALLKDKDERGFDILYQNYSNVLYGVIIRILKDEDEAKDMLQEVFVRIWNRIDKYDRSKGRLYTWMINLTRNFVIDRLRSADYKNHQKNNFVRDDNVIIIDSKYSSSQNIDVIGLQGMVTKLNEDHRKLIQKIYFEGFTQADLAEELGIPLGTLKTRIRAAIKSLRKQFVDQ
ncbi:MAG: sigma-70 family RNA polymerase sigma factor [Cytophagales bacterium]|nr:sigma-70 family RNA polymerase sigma factor [Cytophagales bacterium]